jgi:hypothetical protein
VLRKSRRSARERTSDDAACGAVAWGCVGLALCFIFGIFVVVFVEIFSGLSTSRTSALKPIELRLTHEVSVEI